MTREKSFVREKLKVSIERIAVYKVIENSVEYGWHCLPCSTNFSMTLYCLPYFYTNDVINLLATTELPNVFLRPLAECRPDDVTLTSM